MYHIKLKKPKSDSVNLLLFKLINQLKLTLVNFKDYENNVVVESNILFLYKLYKLFTELSCKA